MRILLPILTFLTPGLLQAQVFDGGGLQEGIQQAGGVTGISDADPKTVVADVLKAILDLMATIAVATVIIAGIYLVFSLGNDDQKDKAKKIIQYTLIGLAVILFSRIIVSLVTEYLFSEVA